MLSSKLAELVDRLLWLFKREIRGVRRDRIPTDCASLRSAVASSLHVEHTAARPDIPDREGRRVMVLRLGWVVIVQLLSVKVELAWLALMREGLEVRELGYWTCVRYRRCYGR